MAFNPGAPMCRLLSTRTIEPFGSIPVTGGTQARGQFRIPHYADFEISVGRSRSGSHSEGSECMMYPPIKAGLPIVVGTLKVVVAQAK